VPARYCLRCGTAMKQQPVGDRIRPVCPACGYIHYVNPIVAAGTLVDDEGRLLLVRRGVEPGRGQWGLPAGFGEEGESPEETAIRETREETGVEVAIDELLGVYGFGDQFVPSGVLILFAAHRIAGKPIAGDDAEKVGLFGPHELPTQIAFRNHREAIAQWARARAIQYAPASSEDWPAIQRMASEWQALNGGAPAILTPQADQRAVVARNGGQGVGFALLRPAAEGATTLTAIYVAPAYRRWGIGTHLLEAALEHARVQGATMLRTRVAANNPALTLFLGAGYAVCGFLDDEAGTWLYLCQTVTLSDTNASN